MPLFWLRVALSLYGVGLLYAVVSLWGGRPVLTRIMLPAVGLGTVFRVLELAPGVSPRNHRTDSIDYAVVMAGEVDMELDDATVHLKAGDVLVQRGTIHNWVNRGTEPCVIAFVLIAAKPATVGGKVLVAQG